MLMIITYGTKCIDSGELVCYILIMKPVSDASFLLIFYMKSIAYIKSEGAIL
jgi:hypothetical protein